MANPIITATITPSQGPVGTTYTIVTQVSGGRPPYHYVITPVNGVSPTQTSPGVWTVTV